jgi:hypothetical protein
MTGKGRLLGRPYVEKHFPAEAQRRMQQMVATGGRALGEVLKSGRWARGGDAPERTVEAPRTFDARIGFPVKRRDYSEAEASRGTYLADKESATITERKYNASKIQEARSHGIEHGAPNSECLLRLCAELDNISGWDTAPAVLRCDADDEVNYGGNRRRDRARDGTPWDPIR